MWNASIKIVISNIIFFILLSTIFIVVMLPIGLTGLSGAGKLSFDFFNIYSFGIKFINKCISCKGNVELCLIMSIGILLPFFAYVLYPHLSFLGYKINRSIILFVDIFMLIPYLFINAAGVIIFHGEDSFGFPVDIVIVIISILTLFIRIYQYKKKLIFSD